VNVIMDMVIYNIVFLEIIVNIVNIIALIILCTLCINYIVHLCV
jgi:hypothetical protein